MYDIVANGYSVREVEQLAKEFAEKNYKRTSTKSTIRIPFSQQQKVHDLSKMLNTSIELKRNKTEKGKIIISFNNDEDFERIIQILKN